MKEKGRGVIRIPSARIQTDKEERPLSPGRARLYEIIFEADTKAGQAFDVVLLAAILLSVLAVLLESVADIRNRHGDFLYRTEWFFTFLFTVEYVFRLISVRRPHRYALSFFGVIDLLAVVPTYFSLVFAGAQTLLVVRILRLLRLFRIFKLSRYVGEAHLLSRALKASRYKITVFLLTVLTIVVVVGALMYLIEGPATGFTSIPRSIYWAIVTMTTVGYGDIAPETFLGQAVAATLMILGYGIIAVPTGIVSVELAQVSRQTEQTCRECGASGHDPDAHYCKHCGSEL